VDESAQRLKYIVCNMSPCLLNSDFSPWACVKLWDFFRPPERNEISKWARKEKLTPRERGRLNQKLDRLVQLGFETAHGLHFLDRSGHPSAPHL
jgi:hypothetical protein